MLQLRKQRTFCRNPEEATGTSTFWIERTRNQNQIWSSEVNWSLLLSLRMRFYLGGERSSQQKQLQLLCLLSCMELEACTLLFMKLRKWISLFIIHWHVWCVQDIWLTGLTPLLLEVAATIFSRVLPTVSSGQLIDLSHRRDVYPAVNIYRRVNKHTFENETDSSVADAVNVYRLEL